jgi:hypothetical protein
LLLFKHLDKKNGFLISNYVFIKLFIFVCLVQSSLLAARRLSESDDQTQQHPLSFQYHNGPLLNGKISVNLIWYGNFKPTQRGIVSDFITSLSSSSSSSSKLPSVATWWNTVEKYYKLNKISTSLVLSLGSQSLDENYSLGKSLTSQQLVKLASKGVQKNAINVVLTASDVTVEGFCSSRCGTHGSATGSIKNAIKHFKFAYIWVGNLGNTMSGSMRVAISPTDLRTTELTSSCTEQ